jgi:hypothetical protein
MRELEELTGVDAGAMVLGSVALATLLAALLTWPVCTLLLALYRRSVAARMRRGGRPSQGPPAAPPPVAGSGAPRVAVVPVTAPPDSPLLQRVRRRSARAQVVVAVAGLAFGLASTAVYTAVEDLDWRPVRTLSLTLVLGCLVVPSVVAQGVESRRAQTGLYAAYLALVVALPVLGGTSVVESLQLLLVVVVVPGAFVLLTGVPSLRGAAWLVAPALALAALAAMALYPVALHLWYGVALTPLTWQLLAFAGGLLAAGAVYGWAVAALYAHKWTSDRTLLVLQWWLVLALVQLLLLATQGATAALLSLTPFAVLVLVLLAGSLLRRDDGTPPVRLLLLRTFGARRRSARLLRDVTAGWRWIGSVELITGTDVASEVLEPHELLHFLRRRLDEHVVADPALVAQRVAGVDLRPDRDGRYRVNDLLCRADTWQPTVAAVLDDVDAVLVDLRSLTAERAGVLHELERLVATFPLERVVALVDATTDARVLQDVLDRAAAAAPAASPLHRTARPVLPVVVLTGRRSDTAEVLRAVTQAASRSRRQDGQQAVGLVGADLAVLDEEPDPLHVGAVPDDVAQRGGGRVEPARLEQRHDLRPAEGLDVLPGLRAPEQLAPVVAVHDRGAGEVEDVGPARGQAGVP